MIVKTVENPITAEQLFNMPDDGNRNELLEGVLKMMVPVGSEHGKIAGRIFRRLGDHVEKNNLGESYAAETGFRLNDSPDTVRAPDAAFVSHAMLATVEPTCKYLPLAPDLLLEVISPSDTFSEVVAKADQWIAAGTKIVLIADSDNLTLHVVKPGNQQIVLRAGDVFDAGDVCGDWQLSVNDAFQIK